MKKDGWLCPYEYFSKFLKGSIIGKVLFLKTKQILGSPLYSIFYYEIYF